MDISSPGAALLVMQQSSLNQQVGNTLHRTALDTQAETAQQLLQAVPKPAEPEATPDGPVGKNLDLFA